MVALFNSSCAPSMKSDFLDVAQEDIPQSNTLLLESASKAMNDLFESFKA